MGKLCRNAGPAPMAVMQARPQWCQLTVHIAFPSVSVTSVISVVAIPGPFPY